MSQPNAPMQEPDADRASDGLAGAGHASAGHAGAGQASAGQAGTGPTSGPIKIILAAVIAFALIGFLVGIDAGSPTSIESDPSALEQAAGTGERVLRAPASSAVLPAMTYTEIGEQPLGPTSQRVQSVAHLFPPPASIGEDPEATPIPPLDPDAKLASLAARAANRAYNGAPPVIPHAVDTLGADSCMTCHRAGLVLEDKAARRIPHPYLDQCVQCHAPPAPAILSGGVLSANEFVGLPAPVGGARAWIGAPPVIPHSTWMRDDCLACHGATGWDGLESRHPWRTNCQQCHAGTSLLDLPPTPHGMAGGGNGPAVGLVDVILNQP
ncbi:MAG: nitrate reductase cytochrome c-type subunit [Phycisphaerales bacterium]